MAERSNEKWITDLQAGGAVRDDALADLRSVLLQGLKYGLRKYLSPADPQYDSLAEESVQEALLKILDNVDSFRGQSRFTTWAHKITLHTALTELRRKRWEDTSLDSLLEADDGSIMTPRFMADPAQNPERTATQANLMQYVERIIAEDLTEKQRRALVATRISGMPMSEVARKMGMKPNALYKLLHDARVRLKEKLAAEGLSTAVILSAFDD